MSDITFENVSKSYGQQQVLSGFNLEIACGDFLAVVGSSGSGKTTILKMINALVKPDSGRVLIAGQDVSDMDLVELRRSIGYSIQGNVLFPHLDVFDNIAFVLELLGKSKQEKAETVTRLMEMFNLDPSLRHRFPHQLSGGQAQRVGIARAYATSPSILLMDEPFGAVDAITRYQLQHELKAWHAQANTTIVFITHDIREALFLGTKVLVLDEGEIQQYGTGEELLAHPANQFVADLIRMSR
ncbi:glycine/betaine ABC transporter ATP-binding protein [Boudabousia tangfeifanii]|uniref:ABC-type quaternary amine transporter n=1 Tax=Boudabousia tangfeifanii TaxID=1912795 RepID=A0A1D9MJT2_9ACTO|nr:ABC transporter ATP-binding protein [Boudabousia tangfeifanii]AOZ72565.1 glycine/betaine ABC transporter ATP-binding protein [Boudabousia tangfeifanii]